MDFIWKKIRNFFLPTLQNQLRPYSLRYGTFSILLVIILSIEFGLYSYVNILFKSSSLLASVLPQSFVSKVINIIPNVLISETNKFRQQNNVSPLTKSPLLVEASKMKAEDMSLRQYFSHVDPDGQMPWKWFNLVNYNYSYAGENLAVNFYDTIEVTNAWIKSPKHHDNLINPKFNEIGIGLAKGTYKGNNTVYIVQFFGARPDNSNNLAENKKDLSVGSKVVASVSASDILLVSPRFFVSTFMLSLYIILALVLILPVWTIFKNHKSTDYFVIFREIYMLLKSSIIVGLIAIIVVSAVIVTNSIVLGPGFISPEGGSYASAVDAF